MPAELPILVVLAAIISAAYTAITITSWRGRR